MEALHPKKGRGRTETGRVRGTGGKNDREAKTGMTGYAAFQAQVSRKKRGREHPGKGYKGQGGKTMNYTLREKRSRRRRCFPQHEKEDRRSELSGLKLRQGAEKR